MTLVQGVTLGLLAHKVSLDQQAPLGRKEQLVPVATRVQLDRLGLLARRVSKASLGPQVQSVHRGSQAR